MNQFSPGHNPPQVRIAALVFLVVEVEVGSRSCSWETARGFPGGEKDVGGGGRACCVGERFAFSGGWMSGGREFLVFLH